MPIFNKRPQEKHGLGALVINVIVAKIAVDAFNSIINIVLKDKVIDLMMNNACIRDTARALHISINAVVRTLKNMLIYQIKLKNYCMNIHLNDKQLNCKISYELKLISSSLEPISIGKFITLPSHIDV